MDFNDYAQPQKSLPWKPIALIAGGVVLLIVVVFVVVRLIRDVREEEILTNAGSQTEASLAACDDAQDPNTCRDRLMGDLAKEQGSQELCGSIDSVEFRDNCYWSIARVSQDVEACSELSEDGKAIRCANGVNEALAVASMDTTYCEAIRDEDRAKRCVELLAPVTVDNCARLAPEQCDDLALDAQARQDLDTELCKEIVDERILDNCLEYIDDQLDDLASEAGEDSDNDGLSLSEEATYGTDPENPDTDGDGYTDGAEVAAGYDPNGPGKLE